MELHSGLLVGLQSDSRRALLQMLLLPTHSHLGAVQKSGAYRPQASKALITTTATKRPPIYRNSFFQKHVAGLHSEKGSSRIRLGRHGDRFGPHTIDAKLEPYTVNEPYNLESDTIHPILIPIWYVHTNGLESFRSIGWQFCCQGALHGNVPSRFSEVQSPKYVGMRITEWGQQIMSYSGPLFELLGFPGRGVWTLSCARSLLNWSLQCKLQVWPS